MNLPSVRLESHLRAASVWMDLAWSGTFVGSRRVPNAFRDEADLGFMPDLAFVVARFSG